VDGTPAGGDEVSGLQDVLNWAMNQRGKPYVWGGTGPDGYDCSGLIQQAFQSIGISLPRTSQEQRDAGTGVSLSDIQPGDVVTFTYPGESGNPGPGNHVALYAGSGQVIEAAHSGVPVRVAPLDVAHVDRVRRIIGGGAGSVAASGAADISADATTAQTAGLQQAGYDAVINLTPWGIPLNPFKLPGWVGGKLNDLAGGAVQGATKGLADTIGPIVMASVAVLLGGGLVLIGAYVTAKPAIDAEQDKVESVISKIPV
jgi:hypothetical protein